MVPAANEAKRFPLVHHAIKTIHDHHCLFSFMKNRGLGFELSYI